MSNYYCETEPTFSVKSKNDTRNNYLKYEEDFEKIIVDSDDEIINRDSSDY
jgi:hypothetical protein